MTRTGLPARLLAIALPALAACTALPDAFDDHTARTLPDRAAFDASATGEHGRFALKFILTAFQDDAQRDARFLDGRFYTLHDEWFWFRLVNGERVPGVDEAPVQGLAFDSVEAIYAWARTQPKLPLDLRWVEGTRLYSPKFYDLALFDTPRRMGLGTLLRVPAMTAPARAEQWVFMLEFLDDPAATDVARFFRTLERALPAAIAPRLKWLVRSTAQEALARVMERDRLPFHDRIVRPADLVVPGQVEIYNEGLTAGRLRVVAAGETLTGTTTGSDLLLVEEVPDDLPTCGGLVSAVPQTPLAHLNLLAKNRGIPNAYRGGALEDLELLQFARFRTPVLLEAVAPDRLVAKAITEEQLRTYESLQGRQPVAVEPIDLAPLPHTYDLASLALADVDRLRPVIGGKSAGFLALLATGSLAPHRPLAVTVRPYAEHLAPIRFDVMAALQSQDFANSARARVLVLEGLASYAARFPRPDDRLYRESFLAVHGDTSVLGRFARSGGIVGDLERRPVAPATLAELTRALADQFGELAPSQGLRFRSSSNVEDIEGFNGAGLYESTTGYLEPSAGDRAKTVETALRRTWASYWRFEAFEERRTERVDHLSGHMAVLVHPRFDDAREVSNGVFLVTLLPPGAAAVATLELNVQRGAESVTNPEGGALPEVDRVTLPQEAAPVRIERLRPSTRVGPGEVVLSDAKLEELFRQAIAMTRAALGAENAGRPPAQARRTLTLDVEFREVAAGWPALRSGEALPQRIVIKQARSLEPGLRRVPTDVQALPFPRDVLARARRVERITCRAPAFVAVVHEAFTDPLAVPDLGHARVPFTASVALSFDADVPAIGRARGDRLELLHTGMDVDRPDDGHWGLSASVRDPDATLRAAALSNDGTYALEGAGGSLEGADLACRRDVLFSSAREFLETLR